MPVLHANSSYQYSGCAFLLPFRGSVTTAISPSTKTPRPCLKYPPQALIDVLMLLNRHQDCLRSGSFSNWDKIFVAAKLPQTQKNILKFLD